MTQPVVVGEIAGAFGVKGWVKVYSHTDPPKNILGYTPWMLEGRDGQQEYKLLSGRMHGHFVVAQLEGVEDRDHALSLRSSKILVSRDQFPPTAPGQYYWADLVGLRVRNLDGVEFGTVCEMLATGANDVAVVKNGRERLIPFVIGRFVKEVNLAEGLMLVDWDADF